MQQHPSPWCSAIATFLCQNSFPHNVVHHLLSFPLYRVICQSPPWSFWWYYAFHWNNLQCSESPSILCITSSTINLDCCVSAAPSCSPVVQSTGLPSTKTTAHNVSGSQHIRIFFPSQTDTYRRFPFFYACWDSIILSKSPSLEVHPRCYIICLAGKLHQLQCEASQSLPPLHALVESLSAAMLIWASSGDAIFIVVPFLSMFCLVLLFQWQLQPLPFPSPCHLPARWSFPTDGRSLLLLLQLGAARRAPPPSTIVEPSPSYSFCNSIEGEA